MELKGLKPGNKKNSYYLSDITPLTRSEKGLRKTNLLTEESATGVRNSTQKENFL